MRRAAILLFAVVVSCVTAGCGAAGEDTDGLPTAARQGSGGMDSNPLGDSAVSADDMGIVYEHGLGCYPGELPEVSGSDIYVSEDGDDGADGATPQTAFRSLALALCSVRPGQTVHLAPGTYRESVILGAFGGGEPIIITGEGTGVLLDGEGYRTMGIGLVDAASVVVEGIEFRNFTDAGLYVLGGSDILVRGNRFADNGRESIDPDAAGEGFGLSVLAAVGVVIEDNEAVGNGPSEERMARAILGTGIDTYEIVDGVIRNNVSRANRGGGILVEEGINVLVEGNTISDNHLDAAGDWWDAGIWVDGGRGVRLRANTVTGNAGPGIQLSDEEGGYPDTSVGFRLVDNVVRDNLYGLYMWGWGTCPDPPADAVDLGENQINDNQREDFWCEP